MNPAERLKNLLASHGHKTTSVRTKVFLTLLNTSSPVTISELVRMVPAVDKVSVYRTIDLFETIGVVHRIWTGFKSRIELSDSFSAHHHHFTCQTCGAVTSFHSEEIERAIHDIERTNNVTISSHVIELSGQCDKCRIS